MGIGKSHICDAAELVALHGTDAEEIAWDVVLEHLRSQDLQKAMEWLLVSQTIRDFLDRDTQGALH
jgi:hypothetical protein